MYPHFSPFVLLFLISGYKVIDCSELIKHLVVLCCSPFEFCTASNLQTNLAAHVLLNQSRRLCSPKKLSTCVLCCWLSSVRRITQSELRTATSYIGPRRELLWITLRMGLGVAGEKECVGWAARVESGHLAPFQFKRRAPGPKDVAFKISYCGVCHTDLHHIRNETGRSIYPMVPGHEIVGIVEEVGLDVTRFKPGDRVGVGCLVNSCKNCDACEKKVEQFCAEGATRTYNSKDRDGTYTYGGYSNYMVVTEDFALKIPENLPLDAAAPLLCAGITVYSPMKYYQMEAGGKNFGVVGLGGLGHMAVKIAKVMGMNVTVISTSPSKEEEARKRLGADNFIVSKDEKQMKEAKGTLDFIIDTVSGSHPFDPYLELLRTNGKLILVGAPGNFEIAPGALLFGRKTVGGSIIGGVAETQEMLDFCGKQNVVCEIEKISMDYVNTALERLEKGDVHYRFVIDCQNSFSFEA